MSYSDFYDKVYTAGDPMPRGPHGWIQWKGTDVCIDLHCSCGHHGHVDMDFFYFYECPKCHQRYAVGCHVVLIPLTDELIALGEIEEDRFKTCQLDEDF